MKYLLILYMCSMNTGQCPNSTISGYQFNSHYDCINAGYAIAQKTYRNLKELEEWDTNYINDNKIVVKFECKELSQDAYKKQNRRISTSLTRS